MISDSHILSPRQSVQEAVLQALWYFDYFGHALKAEELHTYIRQEISYSDLENFLTQAVREGNIKEREGFYGLSAESLEQRIRYQDLNRRWLKMAKRMSYLIAAFPFVRAVYLSGSLSKKGLKGADDDIDFFLITAANRVWTAKFLLMAFKKVFLFNSKKYFCINLLRDERFLSFKQENIYIATEAISLVSLQNPAYLMELYRANPWIFKFFPNAKIADTPHRRKRFHPLEFLLDKVLGSTFENWCRQKFENHVKREKTLEGHFETSPQSSAYFPKNFQQKVLQHYHANAPLK